LPVAAPDWMDRRKIENIKTHIAYGGQARDHIIEISVAAWVGALRTREEFVPACKARLRPLRPYIEYGRITRDEMAGSGACHSSGKVRCADDIDSPVIRFGAIEPCQRSLDHWSLGVCGLRQSGGQLRARLREFIF